MEVVYGYRETNNWVLLDAGGRPVEQPSDWPAVIDEQFLLSKGVLFWFP